MQYLLYPIAVLVLLTAITYLLTFLSIFNSIFRRPKYDIINSTLVPLHLQKVYQTVISELQEFGFKACCYLQAEGAHQIYPLKQVEILLYNQSVKSYAKVGIRYPIEAVNLFDIEFYTFFQDTSLLLTMNGKADGLFTKTPSYVIQDAYTAETLVQWQLHQDTAEKLGVKQPVIALAPDKFIVVLEKYCKNDINYLHKVGKLRLVGEKQYSPTLQEAWRVAKKIVNGQNKVSQILKQRIDAAKKNPAMRVDVPVELEIEGFKRAESINKGFVSGKFRAWMLLISFALFMASYMHMFELHRLAIFALVILLHEAGHLIAMNLCGYRDTSMLFLPFLGAVATARDKYDTTLAQNVWVLLAGPLPGLILGIILACIPASKENTSWIKDAAWMLIGLNFINLLPIYPLDGGKVANLLVFSRFAYSDVLFKLFGLFILGLLSISQPILMIFLILIAFSLPQSFRAAKANSKLQKLLKQSKPKNQDNLINYIYTYFKQFGYDTLPVATRNFIVKDIIRRYSETQGLVITRISLIILYCGSLVGGLTGSLYAISPNAIKLLSHVPYIFENPKQRHERFLGMQRHQAEEATATLRTNPNDIEAYTKRAQAFKTLRNYPGALADYNQIIRLQPNNTQHRFTRAYLNSQLGNVKAQIEDYDHLLKLKHQPHIVYSQRAKAKTKLRDYKGAIADYNELVKLNPQKSWNYIQRGYVYIQLKDHKNALANANKAIQLEPLLHSSYELRSQAYSMSGNTKAANADKQKASSLEQAWEETEEY
jgi:tetratricopeptide (TPR) repeat protein